MALRWTALDLRSGPVRVSSTKVLRPTFRVLRASGAGNFTGAGSAGPAPGYHDLGEFAARLPIRAGDRVGILLDGEAPGRPPSSTGSGSTLLIHADVEV